MLRRVGCDGAATTTAGGWVCVRVGGLRGEAGGGGRGERLRFDAATGLVRAVVVLAEIEVVLEVEEDVLVREAEETVRSDGRRDDDDAARLAEVVARCGEMDGSFILRLDRLCPSDVPSSTPCIAAGGSGSLAFMPR